MWGMTAISVMSPSPRRMRAEAARTRRTGGRGDMAAGRRIVAPAAERDLGKGEKNGRQEDHEDDQAVPHRVLVDVGEHVEDPDGDEVPVVEDERRAQVGERPDEDDDGPGEIAGEHEGPGDPAEEPEARGAEIAGGFLHVGVDVGHRGRDGHVKDRVEVEHLQDDHGPESSAQPVDRLPDHAGIEQEEVDRAEAGEHLLHPHGADEGRQDERDEEKAGHEGFEGELVAVHDPGHRDGQERREQRDSEGEVDAVEDELPVRGVGEHEEKDRNGEAGAACPV